MVEKFNCGLPESDSVVDAASETSTCGGLGVFSWQENDTELLGEQCSGGDCVGGRSP